MPSFTKDLMAASSVPVILSVLSPGERYGYEIIQHITEKTDGKLVFAEGTLYPILKKMELEGWISARWLTGENGRERKYYKLTAAGRKQLSIEKNNWISINEILQTLWPAHLTLTNK